MFCTAMAISIHCTYTEVSAPLVLHYTDGTGTVDKDGGHAVVLINCSNDCLVFMNSWGQDFGDRGSFKVKDAQVLDDMKFYDIFWYEMDLKQSEKDAHKILRETPGRMNEQEIIDLITECPVSITDNLICMLLILFLVN